MNASEDFAFMLRERPGCYFLLGNGEKGEKGGCMVHNPVMTLTMTLSAPARRCSRV
ncbi:Catalyzes the cleavage of p-aminobenzoyl-glutamate to p-aminobenzoate and glutamate, subunit A (plasmid) [Klebsiella aerogenes]|nr:Catalyzes the cleavage of p-aminobenzoyl-glutamate to p-aminobenzoate and glutamate, subunit A [Klebsiella aerogenes]